MGKKLSIIIPFYNAEKYIGELLDRLAPQITKEVEVVIVDDGSDKPYISPYGWAKVIRQKNKGLAGARNTALNVIKGEYVSFIDADDLVAEDFISQVFGKMPFDYCELSWKSIGEGGMKCTFKLNSDNDRLSNCSVCTRVFNRAYIGDNRFNEKKDATEDEDFSRKLGYLTESDANRKVITDFMYFYRTSVENSLSKRFLQGLCHTKRIVYYFPLISKEMTYLLDEIKQEDEYNEVWVMTNKCELPELKRYAQVVSPRHISGMELRGQRTALFSKITVPIHGQIVIWTNRTYNIGGIETFIYNFCKTFKDYDIIVLYNEMDANQIERVKPYCRLIKHNPKVPIYCDLLIINRVGDDLPKNVSYGKTVQMVHTCNYLPSLHVPQNRDIKICVSDTVKSSFKDEAKESIVIKNLVPKNDHKRALLLVTASRFDTTEKGQKRMHKLAAKLNEKNIPFLWIYFSNRELDNAPKNLIRMMPCLNVTDYISLADYLVQLSDVEAFCYSIAEALSLGVPVLTTPLDVLPELGFVDGKTGYTLPFDMENIDVEKIYNKRLKGFKYNYDNDAIIAKWKEVLGEPKRYEDKATQENMLMVKALITYRDIELNRTINKGEQLAMRSTRAYELMQKNFVEIV